MDEYIVTIENGEVKTTEKGECTKLSSGDEYELGGYSWNVISDDGVYLTLLMDADENGNLKLPLDENNYLLNGKMAHCPSLEDETFGDYPVDNISGWIYSWKHSEIQKYLNSVFYEEIKQNVDNEIVPSIVYNDYPVGTSSPNALGYSYGGI